MRRLLPLVALVLLAACGSQSDDAPLPTRFVSPEETAEVSAQSATDTMTPAPTETELPATATVAIEPSATRTATSTSTPRPPTFTPTANMTRVFAGTSTAAVIEAPRFSTLTPLPPGSAPLITMTPALAADVVITEAQFQEELNLRIAGDPRIQTAAVNFVSGEIPGIRILLTALGGQALTSGEVFVGFQFTGSFVAISVLDISVGSGEPPEAYVEIVANVIMPAVVESFDSILTQRLGSVHDLQALTFANRTMALTLLVPMQP